MVNFITLMVLILVGTCIIKSGGEHLKHEITALNTKKTLANSLKKFMGIKPLSKITITEIISDCGLNRKTFYYHFEDIYGLLKWILEEEAVEVVKQFDLLIDYEEAIIFVMDYVDANKHILNCAFDTMGREELKRFFYNDFIDIMYSLVNSLEINMRINVTKDYKDFVCDLYTETLAGLLINWFRDRKEHDREKTINYILLVLRSSLPEVLKSGPKN